VATPDAASITGVNLVSLGTDTHQIDMNQHFVPLSFTAGNGSLNVTMPSSAANAPPGHYMLFILNSSGTPSIASIIGLNPSTTPVVPAAPTGVTAVAGNGSAAVSWIAASNGNSPITSYTITPSTGSTTLTPTVITGNPPSTSATVTGLTNGTAYKFTVTATNAVGTGPASAASNSVTPVAPAAPAAPTGVTAIAGNGSATVSWTASADGGSPITSYTVTPYIGTNAQTPTTVTGTPPAATATVTGLTNGTAYTFSVTATNGVGSSPASSASNAVTPSASPRPAFVQQASTHAASVSSLAVTPSAPLGSGNRLVVEVGVWSGSAATTSSVTDTAGDTFTEISHFTGPDKTEQSIWTAPVSAGVGNTPTVTAKFTSAADGAITALEYSGLSSAAGAAAVDQQATASGTTTTAGTVSSGATGATGAGNELAVGFYSDSGFGDTLQAGSGYTTRTNISNTGDMELLAEDQVVGAGATPSATAGTGGKTVWEMATVVFKAGSQAPPTAPAAPANVTATAGDKSAVVSWTAPADGGSAITSYTVTPYIGSTAQTPTIITGSPPAVTATATGLTNGTAYTFTVTATNGVGTGPASAASNQVTPAAPTAPAAPTGVTATAGNKSATVTWTAPANGGSPITMYTVTPYLAGVAQTPTLVSGSPPATTATVTGLANGSSYTFTVSATNAIGAGPVSAQSQAITPVAAAAPAFVQQTHARGSGLTSISATMPIAVTNGNRLVVEVADWSSGHATVASVTDSAGDTFTELTTAAGPDGTQLSVWTAPVTASGGTTPTIVAKPSAKADMGLAVLEYSGLSSAAGAAAIDQIATATGTTSSARAVSSGSTAATTAPNELAVGFYADSGFGDTLTGDPGYTSRVNVSPAGDMEFLVEDNVVGQAATPAPSVTTGASTIWEMATVVFKS
jgi:titin